MKIVFSRTFLLFVSFVSIVLATVSCGPSLGSTIAVPSVQIQRSELRGVARPQIGSQVYVRRFSDVRRSKSLVILKDRGVAPASSAVSSVSQALEGALNRIGYEFSDLAPVIVTGELREWHATVTGGFRKNVKASSSIFVEVIDPANKRAYSGEYSGFASYNGLSISELQISELLKKSMREAVFQLTKDEQFLKVLSSF